MALTVTKEKNIIFMQSDSKKSPYKFDVNTGIFYGLTGKPVKGIPTGLPSYLEDKVCNHNETDIPNALALMYYIRVSPFEWFGYMARPTMNEYMNFASYFQLADKLESIGYKNKNTFREKKWLDEIMDKNDFKAFVKWYKENPNDTLHDYITMGLKDNWFKKHNVIVGENHVTKEMADSLWNYHNMYGDKNIDYIIYYLTHGLYDYYDGEETSEYYGRSNTYQAFDKIRDYFTLCEKIGLKPEKGDFFRLYINARRTYIVNRQVIDGTKLEKIYNKHPELAFETEELFVKIPTTREDFLTEANAQHNCVYSHYLPEVLKEKTYVVFIRQKNDSNKSYITCEVSNNGRIVQFLGFGNSRVKNERDVAFKTLYQHYLDEIWTK